MNKSLINNIFWKQTFSLALPVALQSLLYSLLALLDQLMVGQKGAVAVVAVSLASKNFGILNFTLMGLTGGLAILSAQLIGNGQKEKVAKIQGLVLAVGLGVTLLFVSISLFFPLWSMHLFTADPRVIAEGIQYHRAMALGYVPFLLTGVYSTVLRNAKIVKLPLYIGLGAVILNALFNYILIFGKFGAPALGVFGSGLATTLSTFVECSVLLTVVYSRKLMGAYSLRQLRTWRAWDSEIKLFWHLTLPLLAECVSFILADTTDNAIYGFMGTAQTVAVTVMGPIQMLIISFFGGFATACSVIVGNLLGSDKKEQAYQSAKQFLKLGALFPLVMGGLLLFVTPSYLALYHLSGYSLHLASLVMIAMVAFIPVKVVNMILTQGVLSAGGETRFILLQSVIGSWVFAIPLGLLSAFILHLPIYWVFIAISFEEILRVLWCLLKMRQRSWLQNLVK